MPRSPSPRERFYAVVTAAIADLEEHGFDSQERVSRWLEALERAARAAMIPETVLERSLRDVLMRTYQRTVESGRILKFHPGVDRFTLAQIKPQLRAELDRRILASANLIRLNREASIQQTLQRFSGWATSIPAGGTRAKGARDAKAKVRRGIAGLPFEERRVVVDQGHKLIAAINELVASHGGAIAAVWRHVKEGPGYQARPEHEARDGKVFVIRDNWAIKRGFMKLAGAKYTDEIEAPGEFIYCRCQYEYLYSLRDLPVKMLTRKGREALTAARAKISELSHVPHYA